MSRRPRRKHSAAFQAKAALAAIRGEKTLAGLAEQFDVHANRIAQWKSQPPEGAAGVLGAARAERTAPRASKRCTPGSAPWRWRTVF